MAKGPSPQDQQAWDHIRQREPKPARRRKIRPITKAQAHLLADLQRQLGHRKTSRGLNREQASEAITRLLARRDGTSTDFQEALRKIRRTPGTHPWERH